MNSVPGTTRSLKQCRLHVAAAGLAVVLPSLMVGCYMPNQERLNSEARTLVHVGMPVPTAIARLNSAHFTCDPAVGGLTCSRIRQRLLPSSCMERINLTQDTAAFAVMSIDPRPIVCAGL
jgi:hypothetical protein